MAEREYRRLTRARSRARFGIVSTSRSSLWLGRDHLLCIDTTGYTENYKRFYYQDIQAFIIRRNENWKGIGLALGVVTLFFLVIPWLIGDAVLWWIFGSLAGILGLGTIGNFAAGPSCTCFLRTAVQTEELVSLPRVRSARRALERLRPLIEDAQGRLAPEELPGKYSEWLATEPTGVSAPASLPTPAVAVGEPVPPRPEEMAAPPRLAEEPAIPPPPVQEPNAPPPVAP